MPAEIDLALAAALPNAVSGSALALRMRAKMNPGDVVLINGATSATGQSAIQIAKHYGASTVVTTGRRSEALATLKTLGADCVILLALVSLVLPYLSFMQNAFGFVPFSPLLMALFLTITGVYVLANEATKRVFYRWVRS